MAETRKLAAILATDIVGYSRLTAVDEEGTIARLRALRHELIDPVIAANHGRTVKTTGDGRLIGSVVDAVRCAVEVQRKTAVRNADIPADRRIEFRAGPGGICLSEQAYSQVRDKVGADFADWGERDLKNIARPVKVFAIAPSSHPPSPPSGGKGRVRGAAPSQPASPPRAVGAGPSLSPLKSGEGDLALPDKPSIAVLPFQNMSGDAEQDYFCDGMVEDIITALARLHELFVIARNSSFAYKGKSPDIRQVGRELGVRYVLEGSVRKAGNRVRITGQLIEAEVQAELGRLAEAKSSVQRLLAIDPRSTARGFARQIAHATGNEERGTALRTAGLPE